MAKKIGTSKSMKKYEGGGQKGPGNGNDSIPKFNPALLDKIRKATMELTRFELSKKLRN
jgi:hypothetical protein